MRIELDQTDLRTLIEEVVSEVMRRRESDAGKLNGRLAYREPEAAAALGIERHALRDARLRGEVAASRLGKRMVYERAELLRFLTNNRV